MLGIFLLSILGLLREVACGATTDVTVKHRNNLKSLEIRVDPEQFENYSVMQQDSRFVSYLPKTLSFSKVNELLDNLPIVQREIENFDSQRWRVRFQLRENWQLFDYVTTEPSRVVIDFYTKNTEPVAKSVNRSPGSERPPGIPIELVEDHQIEVPQDPNGVGFTDSVSSKVTESTEFLIPLATRRKDPAVYYEMNDYVQFPLDIWTEGKKFEHLVSVLPQYDFNLQQPKTAEEKYAKTLETLFTKKRHLSFLKAAGWFQKKYPKSRFQDLVLSMVADTHLRLYFEDPKAHKKHFDLALGFYQEFLDRYPESTLRPKMRALMAYSSLWRGDYLLALRGFQAFEREFSNSPDKFDILMGEAEALMGLGRWEESREVLEQGMRQCRSSKSCEFAVELKKSDVAIQRGDFGDARTRLSQLSESSFAQNHPRVFYNLAEILFRERKWDDALIQLKKAAQVKAYPWGGYVYTRLGEILDILSTESQLALSAYLQAIYYYGERLESGGVFARVRILQSQIPHLGLRGRRHAIDEILSLTSQSSLDKAADFGRMIVAGELSKLGLFEEAMQLLLAEYRKGPSNPMFKPYEKKLKNIFALQFKGKAQKSPIEALQFFDRHQREWIDMQRLDVIHALIICYQGLGVYESVSMLGEKFLQQWRSLDMNRLEDRIKSAQQIDTPVEDIWAKVIEAYAKQGKWAEVLRVFRDYESFWGKIDPEKGLSVGRIITLAYLKTGQTKWAKRWLEDLRKISLHSKTQQPELIDWNLDLFEATGQYSFFDESLDWWKASCVGISGGLCSSLLKRLVGLARTDEEKRSIIKENSEFIRSCTEANCDELKYAVVKELTKNGNVKDAQTVLGTISEQGLWRRLAEEEWRQGQFNESLVEMRRRLPAVAR